MAKDPSKKAKAAPAAPKAKAAKPAAKAPKSAKAGKVEKVGKVAKVAKSARKLAENPATAEVVAATLVAAAAALRNPAKARALATEAADDLKKAARTGVEGGALWQLALDVARKSIDALGPEDGKGKKAKGKKGKK